MAQTSVLNYCKLLMSASNESLEEAGRANIVYDANSFIKITTATEDFVGSQSLPSVCNACSEICIVL